MSSFPIERILGGEEEYPEDRLEDIEFRTAFMEGFVAQVERVVAQLPVISGSSDMTPIEFVDAVKLCKTMERDDLDYLWTEYAAMFSLLLRLEPMDALMLFGTHYAASPACARTFNYMRSSMRPQYAAFIKHIEPIVGEDPFASTYDPVI